MFTGFRLIYTHSVFIMIYETVDKTVICINMILFVMNVKVKVYIRGVNSSTMDKRPLEITAKARGQNDQIQKRQNKANQWSAQAIYAIRFLPPFH